MLERLAAQVQTILEAQQEVIQYLIALLLSVEAVVDHGVQIELVDQVGQVAAAVQVAVLQAQAALEHLVKDLMEVVLQLIQHMAAVVEAALV